MSRISEIEGIRDNVLRTDVKLTAMRGARNTLVVVDEANGDDVVYTDSGDLVMLDIDSRTDNYLTTYRMYFRKKKYSSYVGEILGVMNKFVKLHNDVIHEHLIMPGDTTFPLNDPLVEELSDKLGLYLYYAGYTDFKGLDNVSFYCTE